MVACVAAGLWVSWNGRTLIRPATRLQGYFIWGLVTWAIEALVFLLTGLQARSVIAAIEDDWPRALGFALVIAITLVLVRFVWVFPATYLPRIVPQLRARDLAPSWRPVFLVAFTGLRGVVSLAAALSIPVLVGRRFRRATSFSSRPSSRSRSRCSGWDCRCRGWFGGSV